MSRSEKIQRRTRVAIDKDVEVVVANLTHGSYSFEAPNHEFSLSFDEFGEDDFLTYGQLRMLKKQLENFQLIITDVTSDDVTIIDIIRGLHLKKQYKDYMLFVEGIKDEADMAEVDYLDPEALEEFISEADSEEFNAALKSRIKVPMIETAVAMYKEDRLNDHYKIVDIQETRPDGESEDFWKDIDASLK
ncbi:hypothetical protein [Limosilactobacillus reuteri]|uniref:hypothetical protein n=1 Tax=Limosilactobacillus reuteri TaxID=1598 RepID=UPI001E29975B|nr:hypothetical protein [Limosilactobacillus reuteri]MCC4466848.1 hypothetical protein [Limosilactobacillus reuteri]MCC4472906.1 hypothetical protein [Limosilactobacillus reuteri]